MNIQHNTQQHSLMRSRHTSLTLKSICQYAVLFLTLLMLASCSFSKKTPENTGSTRVIKKKIVMTGFAIPYPNQVSDVSDMAQGLPREMLARLERSGSFLVRQSPNLLSYDLKQSTPSAKLVKQVAAENDAQFVISGEVRNAGIRTDKKYFGLWETKQRHIEIEFSIYDGLSGAFLSKHHLYRAAEDESKIGADKPFGSVVFYATEYGKAIDAVLEESVSWIRRDLSFYPMAAKIIHIADKQITFDAGVTSNVTVGDVALVVANADQLPFAGLKAMQSQSMQYGTAQGSLGKLTVSQAQLSFSIGSINADDKNMTSLAKVGDLVLFDPNFQ